MIRYLAVLAVLVVGLAACGGGNNEQMVWCVGPGETVDADFKKENPELFMDKAVCREFNNFTEDWLEEQGVD